jgi:hypothetical protein
MSAVVILCCFLEETKSVALIKRRRRRTVHRTTPQLHHSNQQLLLMCGNNLAIHLFIGNTTGTYVYQSFMKHFLIGPTSMSKQIISAGPYFSMPTAGLHSDVHLATTFVFSPVHDGTVRQGSESGC